jgi:hypothetical protein
MVGDSFGETNQRPGTRWKGKVNHHDTKDTTEEEANELATVLFVFFVLRGDRRVVVVSH